MMQYLKSVTRFLLVTVGIVVLTSFTIDATDTLRGSNSTLLGLVGGSLTPDLCPDGMTVVSLGSTQFCVDEYENSVGEDCPMTQPTSELQTQENLRSGACQTVSEPDNLPWTHVTFHQAKQLCARAGKRLPNSDEWYEASLGTPDNEACNIDGTLKESGELEDCISARGVFDMVGNVWEWVDEEVVDGRYQERQLPEEGYVSDIDTAGVALTTDVNPNPLYEADYFWATESGQTVMMRGGFYASRSDGGIYAVHTKASPSFSGGAIGFRCVQDVL